MRTIDLITKLTEESENLPQVIAPVLSREGKVRVVIGTHPYSFLVGVDSPGWYILKPMSSTRAEPVREAEPFEIQKCLRAVPGLRVISVRRLTSASWLVFPYNVSDARGRGFDVKPQPCHLVDRNLTPFMGVVTRLWGNSLLFDASRIFPAPTEYLAWLEKGSLEPPEVKGCGPEYETVYQMLTEEIRKAQQRTVEGRIRSAVEYLGAELVGFLEEGEGYSVEWRDGGHTYRTRVDSNLRLVSAGICLSRLEHEQTLASTVAVMRRYREYDYDD